jgi:hypothetical protein
MVAFDRKCPRCSSWEIYKSRFRTLEFLLRFALLRPVRCGDCEQRFFRPLIYAALNWFHPAHQ